MGYKLAGYNVIGCVEIDGQMIKLYKQNHHPKLAYNEDVRDFLKRDDLPPELFDLDVLDGSPPCSVFSMAGGREEGWNKEKQFREGQAEQRLDDLFFFFIDIAKKLQPKVVVAENVKGLILGNARGYVNQIVKRFDEAGYDCQLFLLNAAKMGVPQARERVFFIGRRKDLQLPKLRLDFNEPVITFGEIRTESGKKWKTDNLARELLKRRDPSDRCLADISKRIRRKDAGYTQPIDVDEEPMHTIAAAGGHFRMADGMECSDMDYVRGQTFPEDYDFMDAQPVYVCGMSVPPVMLAQLSRQIYLQFFNKGEKRECSKK